MILIVPSVPPRADRSAAQCDHAIDPARSISVRVASILASLSSDQTRLVATPTDALCPVRRGMQMRRAVARRTQLKRADLRNRFAETFFSFCLERFMPPSAFSRPISRRSRWCRQSARSPPAGRAGGRPFGRSPRRSQSDLSRLRGCRNTHSVRVFAGKKLAAILTNVTSVPKFA